MTFTDFVVVELDKFVLAVISEDLLELLKSSFEVSFEAGSVEDKVLDILPFIILILSSDNRHSL